jgi:hypothetical protein
MSELPVGLPYIHTYIHTYIHRNTHIDKLPCLSCQSVHSCSSCRTHFDISLLALAQTKLRIEGQRHAISVFTQLSACYRSHWVKMRGKKNIWVVCFGFLGGSMVVCVCVCMCMFCLLWSRVILWFFDECRTREGIEFFVLVEILARDNALTFSHSVVSCVRGAKTQKKLADGGWGITCMSF